MKRALLSGYTSQIYTALIGLVMTPVYLHYLGAEAFGLIGFFTMMQAWLQLLDFGLTPTLSRQMARYKGGALGVHDLMGLLRTLEWLFGGAAIVTVVAGTLVSPWLAARWLRLEHLPSGQVALCVALMAAIAGVRWISNIYRSGLIGLERQTLTNGIAVAMASLKFLGVLPFLALVSPSPETFFIYQAVCAIVEVVLWAACFYRILGVSGAGARPSLQALREVLPFAGGLAFTSAVWILLMNLDKLLLSHLLPLQTYGYFTLSTAVAGAITLLIAPISQVAQPRLTILHAQGREQEKLALFREISQFVSCLMAAVSMTIAVFAQPLLLAWTGNAAAAAGGAPILTWYALGNGIVGLLTLPYLVQHAAGNLSLHVIGNILFGLVQIPCVIYAAYTWGAYGTGIVWLSANLIFLFAWVPLVFRRYVHGWFAAWIMFDVLAIWLAAAVPVCLFAQLPVATSRAGVALQLLGAGILSLACATAAGSRTRERLLNEIVKARRI